MTDRHDEDNETSQRPVVRPPIAGEGVRIIGAEEAHAVVESGEAVARRLGDPESDPQSDAGSVDHTSDESFRTEMTNLVDQPFRPAADRDEVDEEPTAEQPVLSSDFDDADWDPQGTQAIAAVDPEADDVAPLPPSEPVESGSAPAPEGLPHWSEPATGEVPIILGDDDSTESGAGLRYRTGGAVGWTDQELETFDGLEPALDDEMGLSALALPPEDDDVAFDREVAARRVRTTPSPRPRPSTRTEDPLGLGAERPDMVVRIVSGVGMAVLALVCLSLGRGVTMVLATVVVGLCTFELFQALHARGFRPATLVAILGAVTMVPLAYDRGEFAFVFVIPLVMVFTLLWFVFEVVHTRPMVNVAVTVGGFVYVGVIGGFAGLLLSFQNGVGLIIGVAVPVIAYDIFGYFVGSQFGKTRLAPAISPNKTVEGLIGGMTGSIIASVLIVKQITPWGDLTDALALGITIAFMAPLGDLAESMLKRDLGIKDFGALLPGHGGVLDRFDALLFCMPAVYFLARALKLG
ncbi:MAG: phosphatidate cytidylyltransferase [Acidimicrobiia bacterium]